MKTCTMKQCGCVVPFESLYQTNDHQYRCQNHRKNGIQHVTADCDGGCGKTLTREHGPYLVIKCKGCQAISRKAKDKEYYHRYYKKKTKSKRAKKNSSESAQRNHKFDPKLYTIGLSAYLPQKGEEL